MGSKRTPANNLRIVTININEDAIEKIKKLVGKGGIYPSRSELIRCAVREFLKKEIKMDKDMIRFKDAENDPNLKNFIKIPVDNIDKNEPIREFKTYKIIKKLENNPNEVDPNFRKLWEER